MPTDPPDSPPPSNDPKNVEATGSVSLGLTFRAGAVIAQRYRIVRFIAQGAMGEVYEARDEMLRETVALKTVRPAIAQDARTLERFKREIHLARRVTHPNVCRLYDVGVDEKTETGSVLFLTMELLNGETLSDRIRRTGRLTTDEALRLVAQMAEALDAAHASGVVHRDFKSGNVVIVRSTDRRRPERAVVTDFGLARSTEREAGDSGASISETGLAVGTPAYMAPEQVLGQEPTPAADIYALGIVMYEMVTGRRPFDGGSAMSVAAKRLTTAPAEPRLVVADLDSAWNAVILRCLEREPAARFERASEVIAALKGEATAGGTIAIPVPAGSGVAAPPASARRRWQDPKARLLVLSTTALVLAAVGVATQLRRTSPEVAARPSAAPSVAPSVRPRRAVAVVGFENTSGRPDAAWLGVALGEILTTELAAGDQLRVASGQEVARLKRELGVGDAVPDANALPRVAAGLGADVMVVGAYSLIGTGDNRPLRIEISLRDGRGTVLHATSATGTEAQLFDLASRSGASLRAMLGVAAVSAAQGLQVEASLPSNPRAARLYADGLARLRQADAVSARDLLVSAVAADPAHPLPHAALSAAWSALGYAARARDEARRASAAASALPERDRRLIEAQRLETEKEWPAAVAQYEAVVRAAPDDVDTGVRLAAAQTFAGRSREALVTVQALRALPPRLAADPRIDLAEARAHQELGEHALQAQIAGRAAEKAHASGARILEAQARLLQGRAMQDQGNLAEALKLTEDARALFEAAGDRSGLGRALEETAAILYGQGDIEGAERLLDRALVLHREVQDSASVARVLNNLGSFRLARGRLAEADALYEKALATFREIGAKHEMAASLLALGARLQNAGELAGAERRYREALAAYGELGEKGGTAMALTNLGEVLYLRGSLEESRKLHEDSLALNREIGDKAGMAYDNHRLGIVFAARGEPVVARDRFQLALALEKEVGDRVSAADTQLALAEVDLGDGRADEALKAADEARQVFRGQNLADREALAEAILAVAALALGRPDAARTSAARAGDLGAKSEDRHVRFATAVAGARVRAASGRPEDVSAALKALDATIAEAARAGLVPDGFEARLRRFEVELAAGRTAAAASSRTGLARDAKAKGFGGITRRVAASS